MVARIPRGRRGAALGGTVVVIVLGTALLLYFVVQENFAAALVGVAGLVMGALGLLIGIFPLFQREKDPNKYDDPKIKMIWMKRPSDNGASTDNAAGR